MSIYHMGCENCFEDFEFVQSAKIGPPTVCIYCGEESLTQIYHPPTICVQDSEPKTLGHLADKNRDSMSQMEFSEKTHEIQMASKVGRKQLGMDKPKKPWWRKTDKIDHRLATLTEKETKQYIETGSKPYKER